jgi:hypothetical protein
MESGSSGGLGHLCTVDEERNDLHARFERRFDFDTGMVIFLMRAKVWRD